MGLLIGGVIVEVPGVQVIGPHEAPWSFLSPGECKTRTGTPHQIILHRTIGDAPDKVMPGAGPAGGAERTAEYFASAEGLAKHAGIHIVVGSDGVAACLCDLVLVETYHATVSNAFSIGIEMHELAGGVLYQTQIDATVAIVRAICEACGIQFQAPSMPYGGHPFRRMLNGGADCVGVFGHRNNTEQRGRWDPGNAIFEALKDVGAEAWNIEAQEDLAVWKTRQVALVANGHPLVVDGIPGRATTAALAADGYHGGVYAFGKRSPFA